ncbi:MAG: nucleoside-diphosphate sugar epimerase [Lysobacteraceae bacterium]|nr:MAG: nucleoside-diphosphate sugar epimerase [Xanthomonadaceae bacterium]
MRTALVFGGSGQIGEPVIARLCEAGWGVVAVSREPRADSHGLKWLRGDLQRQDGLPGEVDAIFSLGPLDHFSRWYAASPVVSPRVVAFGSTSLETKHDSSDAQERSLSVRLHAAEALVFETASHRNAGATLLRPTLVYGAARDRTLTEIARLAGRTGVFILPRSATGLRQPVHVQDLAIAAHAVVDVEATHARSYALPGGETLRYSDMVERTLASLRPPARLVRVPDLAFRTALAGAHAVGKMRGLGTAALARMGDDLVFDATPARQDFGYSPRKFEPEASMFSL